MHDEYLSINSLNLFLKLRFLRQANFVVCNSNSNSDLSFGQIICEWMEPLVRPVQQQKLPILVARSKICIDDRYVSASSNYGWGPRRLQFVTSPPPDKWSWHEDFLELCMARLQKRGNEWLYSASMLFCCMTVWQPLIARTEYHRILTLHLILIFMPSPTSIEEALWNDERCLFACLSVCLSVCLSWAST